MKVPLTTAALKFLSRKLPSDFSPDGGITFGLLGKPSPWPVGANLFTVDQAKAMFKRSLEDEILPTISIPEDVIAGALFDFLGFLTTREETLQLSGHDDAGKVVDALQVWAKTRSLNLEEARVKDWQEFVITTPCTEATSSPEREALIAELSDNQKKFVIGYWGELSGRAADMLVDDAQQLKNAHATIAGFIADAEQASAARCSRADKIVYKAAFVKECTRTWLWLKPDLKVLFEAHGLSRLFESKIQPIDMYRWYPREVFAALEKP